METPFNFVTKESMVIVLHKNTSRRLNVQTTLIKFVAVNSIHKHKGTEIENKFCSPSSDSCPINGLIISNNSNVVDTTEFISLIELDSNYHLFG